MQGRQQRRQKNRSAKPQRNHSERLYRLAVGRFARYGRRALCLGIWVHPTAMHAAVERVGRLRVDIPLPHEAAESRLDVTGWAAKPVIEVQMAKGSIEVIAPE